MKQTKEDRLERQKCYRQSSLGRAAAKRAAETLSEKRRLIAEGKSEKVTRPRMYDGKAVQQTLMMWGG